MNIIRDKIVKALCYYVEKGREAGYSDEELQEVCNQTMHDVIKASRYCWRTGFHRSFALNSLLKNNHDKMVQRHKTKNNI